SASETAKSSVKTIPVEPLKPRMMRPNGRKNGRMGDRNDRGDRGDRGDWMDRNDRADRSSDRGSDKDAPTVMLKGVLDMSREGHGVLRAGFSVSDRDAYISTSQIRRFRLRPGDLIEGPGREPKENERYWGL